MKPERWQQIDTLLEESLDLPAGQRTEFLDRACAGDAELRQEIEALLQAEHQAGEFLKQPALNMAAHQLAAEEARSLAGRKLSHYDVISLIGAGGMGEVYRAKDTRLDRDVAIKVLPGTAHSQASLARFRHEAKAVAALSHPNILAIYDVGLEQGLHYAVTEWLDGETLLQRLNRGAIPWREIVKIAAEIADGLAATHSKGIVHRDLKPGNIFLTSDGRVKILDFGVARVKPSASLPAGSSASRFPVTEAGMVIGTVGYMSPEQVRGEKADAPSDIFALGCVLYEMATGKRAFNGGTAAETMAAIVRDTPSWHSDQINEVPFELQRVILHCLEKKTENRYQSARDLFHELSALSTGSGIFKPVLARGAHRIRQVSVAAGIVVAVTGLTLGIGSLFRTPSGTGRIQFNVALEGMTTIATEMQNTHLAVSPDGSRLAFVTVSSGRRMLWLRARDGVSLQSLPGTENAASPFWSPDNRWIAFFADGKLKKIAASGGPVHELCRVPFGVGTGTWSRSGVILFGGESFVGQDGLYQVSDSGGEIALVARPNSVNTRWFFWPHFLPDGRHFLYLANNEGTTGKTLYAGSLDSNLTKPVLNIDSRAEYVPPGYLLYVRDGTLMAQPFDPDALRTTGVAAPVVDKIQYFSPTGWAVFSATSNLLAYQAGEISSRLTWFDRNGRESDSVGPLANHESPRISPDGQRVAAAVVSPRNGVIDIWVYEFTRTLTTRFTLTDHETEYNPLWSPDGQRFLVNTSVTRAESLPITVVVNWPPAQ